MRNILTAFIGLLAITTTAAMAAPSARQLPGQVTCTYRFSPSSNVDASTSDNLLAEFNYVIAHSLVEHFSDGSEIDGPGAAWSDNGDGTFSVEDTRSVSGQDAAETALVLESFQGATATGLVDMGEANVWTFDTVACVF